MSSFANWFTDAAESTLVAIVPPGQALMSLDTVLAHALAHQHDRDLLIVTPESDAVTFLRRLHLFATTVRVLTYVDAAGPLTTRLVPARSHVLSDYRSLAPRPIVRHRVRDDHLAWARPLVEEAERHGAKRVVTRRYVSWHLGGLQVLRLTSGSRHLRVMAGVQYSKRLAGPAHVNEKVSGPPYAGDLLNWQEVVRFDCTHNGGQSPTVDPAEHRLQSKLEPGMLGLDASPGQEWEREHWGYRAPGRTGFIDFLGIDANRHLHVVETKVGSDHGVLIQALDYATWVAANEDQVRALRGWPARPPGARVHVDLVVAAKSRKQGKPDEPPISGYLAGQIEVLSADIPLRLFVCPDMELETLPPLTPVDSSALFTSPHAARPPVVARRWAARAEVAVRSRGALPKVHPSAEAALLPAARAAYADLLKGGKLHRWVLSTRSSQAYALNLFAPLGPAGAVEVLNELGLPAVVAEGPIFEYEELGDPLAEATPRSAHQTQVDVLLRGADAGGNPLAAFIEVKFTESDFGHCSAYERAEGAYLDNCGRPGLFGSKSTACWQLRNKGQGRRLYDVALDGVPTHLPAPAHSTGGCLSQASLSQPMRNLALSQHWINEGRATRMVFALCAPTGHQAIWRRFAEVRAAFPDTDTRSIVALPATAVANMHADAGADLKARYPVPLL